MNKEFISFLMATYSIVLPLLLGFIARLITKLKKSYDKYVKLYPDFTYSVEYVPIEEIIVE